MMHTENFGTLVKGFRVARDLTQVELAEQVGCSVTMIQKIENGRRRPSKQLAQLLAAAFQIPPDDQRAFQHCARRLGEGQAVDRATVPVPALTREARPDLPQPTTSFVGRTAEVQQVRSLLARPDLRLLTLTGPAGVGKSRLAHHIAARSPGSVCWLDVAGIPATAVAERIAASMDPAPTDLLLVLDNCEPLADGPAWVAAILATSRQLKILATSRAALGVYGEQVVPVGPLAWPVTARGAVDQTRDWGTCYPALQLFQDRAQAILPGYAINATNIDDVAALCACLDGLPLALELAAARVRCLPPRALLARRERLLDLLDSASGTAQRSHHSMRALLAEEYAQLDAAEKRLLIGLAHVPAATLATLETGWEDALGSARAGAEFSDLLENLARRHLVHCIGDIGEEPCFAVPALLRLYIRTQVPVEAPPIPGPPDPTGAILRDPPAARVEGKLRRFPIPVPNAIPVAARGNRRRTEVDQLPAS